MRLYSGTSDQFIQDTIQNQIAEKLTSAFFEYYRYKPPINEINSWKNSLRAMTLLFQHGNLHDHGVLLEYQLPLTSMRLDCMICGKDQDKKENAVIVELKQWDKCFEADGENEVLTWVGGRQREVPHPSAQVMNYKLYLKGIHPAFYDGASPVILNACSYLHNYSYSPNDAILSEKFKAILEGCPMFSADDVDKVTDYLCEKLGMGQGIDVLKKVEVNNFRASKTLMDHVGNVIKGNPEYILLDEQLVVYDKVLSWAKKGFHDKKKRAIIIKGGPGTGKSVIAINLMADLLLKGYNTVYATGSRAFTQTLRKIIGPNGYSQFKYFNGFRGLHEFNLFAIWAMNDLQDVRKRYIGQVFSAITHYKALLDEPTVIIGDFNWNVIWDAKPDYPLYGTFTDVIRILESNKIRSVYHEFYNEGFGEETKPTLFMYHRKNRPYHVDYCFASSDFNISNLEVGHFDHWIRKSDHMPIIVTFDEDKKEANKSLGIHLVAFQG